MVNNNHENNQLKNNKEYKRLATNTFYSYLINYGSFFFTLIYSFLLARLIINRTWDFLILATSYITIIGIIISLLPPGLNHALNYYIPRYLALNEKKKIKALIKNTLIIKSLFTIIILIISIVFFTIFEDLFAINLEDNVSILVILSPTIFFNSLGSLLDAINRGFSKFNFLFLILLIKNAFHICPLLIYYIFDININIDTIALIVMISSLIPFILKFLYVLIKVIRIKPVGNEIEPFKKDIFKSVKYGGYLTFSNLIAKGWREAQLQGVGFFESAGAVTGFNIALNYSHIGQVSVGSFYFPLWTSFTSLSTKKEYDHVVKIFKIASRITLFLLLILSGILFFSVDFFLDFVFLESRLIFSNILKLIVFAAIFQIFKIFVLSLLNAQNKVKLSFLLNILYMTYYIPLFFIGLIYGGIEGAIIFGLIIGNIISLIIQIYSIYKIGNIKINIKKIILQYLTFFIPLVITVILENLILKEINITILHNLGLSLFINLDFLSIGTFIVLFILMNLVFGIVKSTDFEYFESLLSKDKFLNRIMLKTLNVLKKFTRRK